MSKVDLSLLNLIQQGEFTAIIKNNGMKLVGAISIDNRLKRVTVGLSTMTYLYNKRWLRQLNEHS